MYITLVVCTRGKHSTFFGYTCGKYSHDRIWRYLFSSSLDRLRIMCAFIFNDTFMAYKTWLNDCEFRSEKMINSTPRIAYLLQSKNVIYS